MAMEGKVERELELKSSADKFFKRLASELHHAPNASPEKVHAIEVHGGDFSESHGSVQLWTYTIGTQNHV